MTTRDNSFDDFCERMEDQQSCAVMRDFIAQFANPVRIKILCWLVRGGPLCVTDLVKGTGEKQSTISQQLKQLQMTRMVTRNRRGNRVYYSIGDAVVEETMHYLSQIAPSVARFLGDDKTWK